MKSQVICDALNTVNPTPAQITRMRAALEAQLPAEKPHRRGAHQQKASTPRWWTIILWSFSSVSPVRRWILWPPCGRPSGAAAGHWQW